MLIEKEIISPGIYWYTDEKTGLPRKLDVTSDLTRYWQEQGSKMLGFGLTVPVPYEHDFTAHPMTPKDKLLNNAGEVKEYRLKDIKKGDQIYDPARGEVKDALFGVVDIQDSKVKDKIGNSIRWSSPWINSFMDGDGRQWNNVISHLALTTRPRITKQQPFSSIAAALSMATQVNGKVDANTKSTPYDWLGGDTGICLTRAGLLFQGKPVYPIAFSLVSGVALGDFPPPKKDKKAPPKPGANGDKPPTKPGADGSTPPPDGDDSDTDDLGADGLPGTGDDSSIDLPPLGDKAGDVSMEEVLCDLLRALGVDCTHDGDESQFKRNLYAAAMKKVHDLTNKGMNKDEEPKPGAINQGKPPGSPGQPNPLVQQEQQPMYMSLEEINTITDPVMKNIALSMYNENVKIRAEADADRKKLNSLNDAKLKEENIRRQQRVALLSRVSPKVKADLEAMLALPSMALSMGEGGTVVDPMAQILDVLGKGLSDLPKMLTTDASALQMVPQPTDETALSLEEEAKVVDNFSRMMGAAPPTEKK